VDPSRIFAALACKTRFAVLEAVGSTGSTATRIAAELKLSVSTASRHLHELRRVGLLESVVHGRERRFRWRGGRRLVIGFQPMDPPRRVAPESWLAHDGELPDSR